jgi:hypothetical protein
MVGPRESHGFFETDVFLLPDPQRQWEGRRGHLHGTSKIAVDA